MTGDTATSVLREEHQLILQVVSRLEAMLDAERSGDPLDYDTVAACITFFRLFADACHHGKEEDLLFPELEAEGMPRDNGPIAMLLQEHVEFRALVRTMAGAIADAREGDDLAGSALRRAAAEYLDRIQAHIGKEDNGLFEVVDEMIVGPQCVDLCARYDEVCARRFEGKTLDDLEHLASTILAGNPS